MPLIPRVSLGLCLNFGAPPVRAVAGPWTPASVMDEVRARRVARWDWLRSLADGDSAVWQPGLVRALRDLEAFDPLGRQWHDAWNRRALYSNTLALRFGDRGMAKSAMAARDLAYFAGLQAREHRVLVILDALDETRWFGEFDWHLTFLQGLDRVADRDSAYAAWRACLVAALGEPDDADLPPPQAERTVDPPPSERIASSPRETRAGPSGEAEDDPAPALRRPAC